MVDFLKAMQNMASNTDAKQVDQRIIAGGSKYLDDPGTYSVRLTGVDRNKLNENKISFKWEDAAGRMKLDNRYLTETDRKTGAMQWDWRLLNILGALIPATEAYDAFFRELAAGNFGVFDTLVGMHCDITTKYGKGYTRAESQMQSGVQVYRVYDGVSGDVIGSGNTIAEAVGAAEKAGYERAYVNVYSYQATHGAANLEQFIQSIAGTTQPARPTLVGGGQLSAAPWAAPAPVHGKRVVGDDIPF